MGRKKEIYGDVRFFHGALQLPMQFFLQAIALPITQPNQQC